MLRSKKIRRLTGSIMGLFVTKKPNITRKNHPNLYYKNYYFPQNLCEGIELVAAFERISKKAAAQMIIEAGFSSYMGQKVTEYIEDGNTTQDLAKRYALQRWKRIICQYAKAKGLDPSKFF